MKRFFTLLIALFFTQAIFATIHTINIAGLTYSPATTSALVGDTVVIQASGNHPLVQVDSTNWFAGVNTPMGGGWGVKTTTYQFTITGPGTIYFMCQIHGPSMGMKGKINVSAPTGLSEQTIGRSISVFPNPVETGNFTVVTGANAPDGLSLELYNTEGQIIEKHKLATGTNSLITLAPAGAYLYAVKNTEGAVYRTGKLFVTR